MHSNDDNRGNTLALKPAERDRFNNIPKYATNPRSSSPRTGDRPNGNRSFGGGSKHQAPKGHDVQLKDAQDNGLPVFITLMGGNVLKGNIANRDRYTVTIITKHQNKRVIVYKHAIATLEIVQRTEVAAA
jgi:RNA chaperone Hfq